MDERLIGFVDDLASLERYRTIFRIRRPYVLGRLDGVSGALKSIFV
jgi:hypothetical protein